MDNIPDGEPERGTGVAPYEPNDFCGTVHDGQTLTCNGNLDTMCSDYGVATWNGLSCRTFCGSKDDPNYCYQDPDPDGPTIVGDTLICDKLA
jgi:hypothetical protein